MSTAPGELELVREFLNTADGAGADDFVSPAELVAWLSERSLLGSGVSADEHDLERSRELREALRELCLANSSGELDAAAPPVLDAAAQRAGLRLRFGADGEAKIAPSAEGVDEAHGRLLAIVAESMRAGTWERLKACRCEKCRWAFFDASKNHSRVWCSMEICGNRAKAQSFRERHASA
jgi:predicted RNA-binding Zn ribbon-like protein